MNDPRQDPAADEPLTDEPMAAQTQPADQQGSSELQYTQTDEQQARTAERAGGGRKVSVGRIVHVVGPKGTSNGADYAPGIVTRVWGDDMINVTVFPDGATPIAATSVHFAEQETDARAHLTRNQYASAAFWPPQV
jgi:hypothetical protein